MSDNSCSSTTYGGYDLKTKSKTLYECSICKRIIKHCIELPCTHLTCRSCLEHWEDQQKRKAEVQNEINGEE